MQHGEADKQHVHTLTFTQLEAGKHTPVASMPGATTTRIYVCVCVCAATSQRDRYQSGCGANIAVIHQSIMLQPLCPPTITTSSGLWCLPRFDRVWWSSKQPQQQTVNPFTKSSSRIMRTNEQQDRWNTDEKLESNSEEYEEGNETGERWETIIYLWKSEK